MKMKKTLMSLMALATLLIFASCQKETTLGNGTQFRATMEDCTSAKTTLNGTALEWVSGDQIVIYGTAGSGIYSATPQSPATVAVFDNVSGNSGNAPFRAFYPTTLTTDGVNVTLSATQTYVEGSINEFPMYAESSNEELSFKNLCGVLKLNLTKTGVNIISITVTAASEINGTFSVAYNGGDPELEYVSGGTNTTTLTCATAQSIASGKDFYIYLPEGSYSGLRIEMNTNDNRYCVKTANTAINVARSQYTLIALGESNLNFVEPLPQGALSGLFTINSDGDQVRFSQGNLQYQASNDIWRFAEHQYDYVGGGNENISATYSGWIDLFGWGTGNNPLLSSTSDYDYSTFVDWGVNPISNGGMENNQWRTLTEGEWSYLLLERQNATTKYGSGNINGIGGMIVLPDSWELPDGCTFNPGMNGWNNNSYTLVQWINMEANGALFLPAAGYKWQSDPIVLDAGDYQTASTYTTNGDCDVYRVAFSSNTLYAIDYDHNRRTKRSVRLVRDNY